MTHPLPYDDYQWVEPVDFPSVMKRVQDDNDDLMGEDERSYILEVDLAYDPELSASHSSYPMAPHTMDIRFSDLSPFSQHVVKTLTGRERHQTKKLTASMRPREKYLVHAANLKFYLKHGLRVTKVHRVISFRQRSYLRQYIHKCTEMRRQSRTKAEATVWKLCVNSYVSTPPCMMIFFHVLYLFFFFIGCTALVTHLFLFLLGFTAS